MAIAFSVNTQNNAEARKTIFEEALGLNQANLASITIGFNRLRTSILLAKGHEPETHEALKVSLVFSLISLM